MSGNRWNGDDWSGLGDPRHIPHEGDRVKQHQLKLSSQTGGTPGSYGMSVIPSYPLPRMLPGMLPGFPYGIVVQVDSRVPCQFCGRRNHTSDRCWYGPQPQARLLQPQARLLQPQAILLQPQARLLQPQARLLQPQARPVFCEICGGRGHNGLGCPSAFRLGSLVGRCSLCQSSSHSDCACSPDCQCRGCRNPQSHSTADHICGLCRGCGHNRIECPLNR